ncbi:MAG: AMIN domain-containing protein [Humidesulfovibrio sp.]|nr:AMIN domain-containing protein [Humidesulfovibrio sp.]
MAFYRRFYILLFLIWLGATAGVFVLTVWGDLGTFLTDFQKIASAGMEPSDMNASDVDAIARAADKAVQESQMAKYIVRREVSREVLSIEKGVKKVFRIKDSTTDAAVETLARDREAALRDQPRLDSGTGELKALTFTKTSARMTAHLSTTKMVDKVTTFWMSHPTRLVVDLRGGWENVVSRTHTFTDSFISRVVIGTQPDRLRVVFNFQDTKAPQGGPPDLIYSDKGLDIVVDNTAK